MNNTVEMNETLIRKMLAYYSGDPARIQHYTKVYTYASMIGHAEHLSDELQHILETAAILHDIGIKIAEEKYHCSTGPLQEKEGPSIVRTFLADSGMTEAQVERIAYLVGHHHTLTGIDGMDYQILIEADYLVNASEKTYSPANVQNFMNTSMKTESGKKLAKALFRL